MDRHSLENDVNYGMSSHELAKKYKKGQTTILYWMKKFRISPTNKQIGKGYKHFYGKDGKSKYQNLDWNYCQKLHDSGLTWRELVKRGFPSEGITWAVKRKMLTIRSNRESVKLAHASKKYDYSVYRTDDFRKKHSKCGGLRENAGRCKKVLFTRTNGEIVSLQGSWEVKFAKFLESKSLEWKRNKVGHKYMFEEKEHLYFPDFWVKEFDSYVEVKGYETEKDRAKWKQFPFNLLIIKKNDIGNLEEWYRCTGGRPGNASACKAA